MFSISVERKLVLACGSTSLWRGAHQRHFVLFDVAFVVERQLVTVVKPQALKMRGLEEMLLGKVN